MFQQISANIRSNWQSGLTVALVSLPLSIALSVASGAGPIPGVITGVWATIIAGIFGGSNYNIIGVAGALSTILLGFALGFSPLYLPLIAVFTGAIILLIYFLKLEKYLIYVPSSVMYGFAAGVAIQIAISQLNDALGLDLSKVENFLENLAKTFEHIGDTNYTSVTIFALSLGFLLVLKKLKSPVPGVIPLSILGIVLGLLKQNTNWLNFDFINLQEKLKADFSPKLIQVPDFSLFRDVFQNFQLLESLLTVSIIVAVVAILETLITAKIADKITSSKFNTRKEMLALALSNLGSGFLGGLPATGVFIRTGLNIKSGATHKTSQIITGVVTAVLAVLFLPYFKYIPMAVIAGILFNTAIGLIEVEKFKYFWKSDKRSFVVAITVAALIVFRDASVGIFFGTALALLFFVDKLSKGEFEVNFNANKTIVSCEHGNCFILPKNKKVDVIVYSIEGIMAYLDAPAHLENFQKMSNIEHLEAVVIRMRDIFYLDLDGLEIMEESVNMLQARGIKVLLTKPCQEVLQVLRTSEIFRHLEEKGLMFEKTTPALVHLGFEKGEKTGTIGKKEIEVEMEYSIKPEVA